MEPNDKELKKDLADGPLIRNGFNDELRKRIGQRIDEQQNNPAKRMPWFSAVSIAVIFVLVLAAGGWNDWFGTSKPELAEAPAYSDSAGAMAASGASEPHTVRSAMLIGLRTDYPASGGAPEYSTYRTVLLAPDRGHLQKVAEGGNILMPYKMDFWTVAPRKQSGSAEEAITLDATPAAAASKAAPPRPEKPLSRSEKLLFAGNRYLTVAQQQTAQPSSGEAARYVWVKEVSQLAASSAKPQASPLREPHVTLTDVFGEAARGELRALRAVIPPEPSVRLAGASPAPAAADEKGESWAIVRERGKWVPEVATYDEQPKSGVPRYELEPIALPLPETVSTYDRLSAGWNEIERLRPDAKDAFTSPNREMAAIVTTQDIVIYPLQDRIVPAPLLTLPLAANESVIMVQWAADEPYVELWKQKARALLAK